MRQFFYALAQHEVLLRALLVIAVMVAVVIAIGAPEIALAGPDANGP